MMDAATRKWVRQATTHATRLANGREVGMGGFANWLIPSGEKWWKDFADQGTPEGTHQRLTAICFAIAVAKKP